MVVSLCFDGCLTRELIYDHQLYFESEGDFVARLELLVATKPPESQPRSVEVAEQRMLAAAAGSIGRRGPITVHPRPDGRFDIVDGNATYAAALRAGWPDLPACLVRPD